MATPAAVQQQASSLRAATRMTMSSIQSGRQTRPYKIVVYGEPGVGKTTFGASAEAPIFLSTEDGLNAHDTPRFPTPSCWQDVLDAIRELTVNEHSYKTLVIDTLDWMEPLLWAHICKRDKKENIPAYGYGKGEQVALDEWRVFVAALERLRDMKDMCIVLLAHSWIKTFKNPEGEDYDRYELKIEKKAAGLMREWSDTMIFAKFQTIAERDDRKRVRGVSTGTRLAHTTPSGAFDAKNRIDLPEEFPFSWEEFIAAARAGAPADPKALRTAIEANGAELPEDMQPKLKEHLATAGEDPKKLAKLNSWINAKLAASKKE